MSDPSAAMQQACPLESKEQKEPNTPPVPICPLRVDSKEQKETSTPPVPDDMSDSVTPVTVATKPPKRCNTSDVFFVKQGKQVVRYRFCTKDRSQATKSEPDQPPAQPIIIPEPDSKEESDSETDEASQMEPESETEAATSLSQSIREHLLAEAYENAPLCGKVRLKWMTISQAATTLKISKSVLSTWATRGYIASVKGNGANDHRLVHIEDIVNFLVECIENSGV